MDKYWTRLVIIGFILVLVVVSWDFIMSLLGYKSDFRTIVIPMSPVLYGRTESLFRADPNFQTYQEQANAEQGSSSSSSSSSGQ
jgi:hypothetical protein